MAKPAAKTKPKTKALQKSEPAHARTRKGPGKKTWAADNVQRRPVADLIPYARNARLHSDKQVKQIAASIKRHGWTNPIIIDEEGGIIAGHGRVLAAQKLNYESVPCAIATGWTEDEKRAYLLADNQLVLNADWDMGVLKDELRDLSEAGFDMEAMGFDVEALLDDEEESDDAEKGGKTITAEAEFILILEFDNEADLAAAYDEQMAKGVKCKIMS